MPMTPERWRRVEEIYHSALARDARDRAPFLENACEGDEALRRDVESLLAQRTGGKFLEWCNGLRAPGWKVLARAVMVASRYFRAATGGAMSNDRRRSNGSTLADSVKSTPTSP
jgi:hypothetical protein